MAGTFLISRAAEEVVQENSKQEGRAPLYSEVRHLITVALMGTSFDSESWMLRLMQASADTDILICSDCIRRDIDGSVAADAPQEKDITKVITFKSRNANHGL